jgi:hypothetical protein
MRKSKNRWIPNMVNIVRRTLLNRKKSTGYNIADRIKKNPVILVKPVGGTELTNQPNKLTMTNAKISHLGSAVRWRK